MLAGKPTSGLGIDRKSALESFKIIKPKPSPYPLIRIGGNADGSYLLPNDLEGITGCLSPGVNNFKDFEDELALKYAIPSDLIDASSDEEAFATALISGMQTFQKKWLDISGGNDCMSISEWLHNKPNDQNDFLLQIDIEGAEYRNILATPSNDLQRFRVIVMELHRLPIGFSRPQIFQAVMKPFLEKLDDLFICVHAHPNNVIGTYTPPAIGFAMPRILELTFLRRDRFPQGYLTNDLPVSLPNSLDITNVMSRPPLHLSDEWLTGPRSVKSRICMSLDWIQYYNYHKSKRNLKNLLQAQAQMQLKKRIHRLKSVAGSISR